MSMDILLWLFLSAFVIHLIDETTINGGFINWMKVSFWPGYTPRMNFWFNAVAILLIFAGNLIYEIAGGHWIILVLAWPFGFALHGLTVHLFWTIKQKNLSPGLMTSIIYWIMAYFFVRYGYLNGQISSYDFWAGLIFGVIVIGGFLTFVPPVVIPAILRSRKATG